MSQAEKDFPWDLADRLARKYISDLEPFCRCLQIVGSVRRRKDPVHDIEIMVIPQPAVGVDLFGALLDGNLLEENYRSLVAGWDAKVLQAGQKKKKLLMPEGITLELHISSCASWAVEMVIRTGPAEFSHRCVMPRKHGGYLPSDCRIHDGWQVFRGTKNLPMASERDFLKFLGLGWIGPEKRHEYVGAVLVSAETVKA